MVERAFARIADRIEWAIAHPFSVPIFSGVFLGGLLTFGEAPTNLAVSYVTTVLLFMLTGGSRRSGKAMHAKLDDIEKAIPEATTENARLEEKLEREIDECRDGA